MTSATSALSYEWARLRTVRPTWWLAGASVFATALGAWAYTGVTLGTLSAGQSVNAPEAVVFIVSKPSFAPLVAGILGIFAVANDYRYGTMSTTLLVTPRRRVALGAKAAVVAGFSALLAVVTLAVAWAVGSVVLGGRLSLSVSAADFLQVVMAQMTLTAGWALFGVAVAVVVRSQVVALAVVLAIPFPVEGMVRSVGMLSGQSWMEKLAGHLPFAAGSAMTDISHGTTGSLMIPTADRIGPLLGASIFLATIGTFAVLAALHFDRQDIG